MLQKLKRFALSAVVLLTFLAPVAVSQVSFAANGPCPGSDAPYPVDCSKIPLGCPGSSLQGPVSTSVTLACPWNPTSTFTCPAKKCTFTKVPTLNHGQTYKPGGSGGGGGGGASGGNCSTLSKCDLITKYINPLINFLAALVGIAVVISIIIGGIQYGSSAGDPQKVSAAKNRIRNAIVALVTFMFLYALLNFLMPGGLV